jgi:hypothetical protein
MEKTIPEEKHFFAGFRAQMQIANGLIWQETNRATVYAVFIEALCAQHHNEGYIRLQPRKLADDLGISEEVVLDALDALQALGILIEHPQGWAVARKLAVNPHVAWKGRPDIRDVHLRSATPLQKSASLVTEATNVIRITDCRIRD